MTTDDASAPQAKQVSRAVEERPGLPIVAPPVPTPDAFPEAVKNRGEPLTPSDDHLGFAEQIHQYVRENIRNADQKAAFFFAASTAALGYLLAHQVVRRWLAPALAIEDYVSMVAVAGLMGASGFFLSVVFPRLTSSIPGLIFFKEIAAHSGANDYAESALATPVAELARTKLRHAYDLAQVCRTKYRLLRVGFRAGLVGGVAALLYLALRATNGS